MYQLTAQIQQFSTGLRHSLLNIKEAKSLRHMLHDCTGLHTPLEPSALIG